MAVPIPHPAIAAAFARFDDKPRAALLQMREWILEEGERLPNGIDETLKWGEPSYLGRKKRIGTTVRLGAPTSTTVALYVSCQTTLVATFQELLGDAVSYEGKRAVTFDLGRPLPKDAVKLCARMAFHYHLDKRATPAATQA